MLTLTIVAVLFALLSPIATGAVFVYLLIPKMREEDGADFARQLRETETNFSKLVSNQLELQAGRLKRQLKKVIIESAKEMAKVQAETVSAAFVEKLEIVELDTLKQADIRKDELEAAGTKMVNALMAVVNTAPKRVHMTLKGLFKQLKDELLPVRKLTVKEEGK